MRRALKSIDFYKAVPNQLSQGTISGACISIATVCILTFLVFIAIAQFLSPSYHSDMIVDQKHLQQKLKVNIDIEFLVYPCSMLSLDIENVLRVHEVNIGDTIQKFNLNDGSLFADTTNREESKRRIMEDFKLRRGCRMTGFFYIDPVPGNFHFSCHGYGGVVQELLTNGQLKQGNHKIDMSHRINYLYFGEQKMYGPFSEFESRKQIGEMFLGISYTYFLDIVQSNIVTKSGNSSLQYHFTARMNQVILASAPIVLFKYETSPISIILMKQYQQNHVLFVKLVGIVGGIFTVATIIDALIHSSIRFLVEKHRLGKLR